MFEELAARILSIGESEVVNFIIKDFDFEITLGIKHTWEFDSSLVIMGAYGGGFNAAFYQDSDYDSILTELDNIFGSCKFVNFAG